jgi:hypothetical protein
VALTLQKNSKRSLRLALLLVYIGLPLLVWFGPPGGWERWLDPENIQPNLAHRIDTGTGALAVSLEHPAGLGIEEGRQELEQIAGSDTSHNAYLQTAVQYGLPFAAALMVVVLALPLRMWASPSHVLATAKPRWILEAMVAIQLFGVFWFEEHLNSPVFVMLIAWIAATAVARVSPALKQRGSTERAILASERSYDRAL